SSCCRPTKRVSPRAALACKRRRIVLTPTSSKTSTGSVSPLTGNCPRALTWTRPSASRRVAAVSRMLPGGASCSKIRRAACASALALHRLGQPPYWKLPQGVDLDKALGQSEGGCGQPDAARSSELL